MKDEESPLVLVAGVYLTSALLIYLFLLVVENSSNVPQLRTCGTTLPPPVTTEKE